ncbi:MAG: CusA/CzcA family heavy metal efflux RND transporter, partial [Candidatus Methylomirabilis sp.]|nr:CusA/CzcA family heavy metal efflux RND transporter [Deltaproteobacteria bacterium]
NQVQINTEAPALSPVEVEKQITFSIESALAGIPGLEHTRSLSRNGFSQVTAVFGDDVDIYFARQQVAERLIEARESLPPGTEPTMGAVSTGLGEIYMYAVEYAPASDGAADAPEGRPGLRRDGSYLTPEGERLRTEVEKAAYLRTVQDWIVRPQLKTVPGVAGVDSIGGYEKQYLVEPDPRKLLGYGFGFRDLIAALERDNASVGAGFVELGGEAYVVRADGRLRDAKEIAGVVLGTRGGTPIRVGDVARVSEGGALRTGSATENGREIVVGTALMLIGENSRTVARAVDERIAEIRKTLPPDVRARTLLDRTALVDETIRTVRGNLIEGALLVVAVLFVLLGNFRAALIAAAAIPLSMLFAATGMVRAGISGNLMSLGAIDFGIIVDGAVIVVENCARALAERRKELGRPLALDERLHEVMAASKQMIQPSVFGQAIIVTVYLPILALSGVEGKMFHPMAMTVIFALIGAFILSLTFVPAMVALFVTGEAEERESRLIAAAKRRYEPLLRAALVRRWAVVLAAAVAFAAAVTVFTRLGREFVPTLDEGDVAMQAMRMPSTGVNRSTEMQEGVERAVGALPEVAFVFSKTGTAEMAADPMPPNVSDTFIMLKPRGEWPDADLPKGELIRRIEEAAGGLPGQVYEFTQPIQMRFNELIAGVRGDVAIKVFGDHFEETRPVAEAAARVLRVTPGAADVKVEQAVGLPRMDVVIDREAAARYGLSVADVQDVVAIAVGGREAGLVFQGDRRFDLIVRLPDALREDRVALENLPIPLPGEGRAFAPLSSVARIEITEGPNQVSRENGKRRVVVQANVRDRDLGGFVEEARRRVEAEVTPPPGVWLEWGGQFENLAAASARLAGVVPLCFLLIFALLFGAFNSVKHAAMVFSGVPLALTGGVLALWLRGMPFSISAAVGFIALSGVAVLNGLVMVTYINHLHEEGLGLEEAIVRGSMTRLRPVLMTALVAALGFAPMAVASGKGAEVQKPLATVVIGGILTSTALT